MTYWLQYVLLKVGVLTLLLTGTVLFAIKYPAMWAPVQHWARWQWVPAQLFEVSRFVVPVLFVSAWFAYFMAARRLGRPA